MKKAKDQFLLLIAKWISNPNSLGTAIGLHGPMGTGKTTLIKNGVSKILGREFAFVTLGGASDGSYLDGHSYTYEGSTYGRLVDILIQTKSSNPIIFFDELDKVSSTEKGNEIIGILTHLTDTTQNSQFHDKYFSEIDLDMSKCLFIFSYNDESLVNPILKDRMYTIETDGYDMDDKKIISRKFLIPDIIKELSLPELEWEDEALEYMIKGTNEEGVRNLKRMLETVASKINVMRIMKPESITFPFTVTRDYVKSIIQLSEKQESVSHLHMYI
jgi:ATP-dependent Lon protease